MTIGIRTTQVSKRASIRASQAMASQQTELDHEKEGKRHVVCVYAIWIRRRQQHILR